MIFNVDSSIGRSVEKNSYGLDTETILLAEDTDLKKLVSLKRMAP